MPSYVSFLEDLGLTVEGLYTHFADAWRNDELTKKQLDLFLKTVEPYRNKKLLHVSNSGGIFKGIGTDLDFIRPGMGESVSQSVSQSVSESVSE